MERRQPGDDMNQHPPSCPRRLATAADPVLEHELTENYGQYRSVFGIRCTCGHGLFGFVGKDPGTDGRSITQSPGIARQSTPSQSLLTSSQRVYACNSSSHFRCPSTADPGSLPSYGQNGSR
jgi:hypothetical protein